MSENNVVVPVVPIIEFMGLIDNNSALSLMNAVNQHIYNTQNLSKIQIHISSPGGDIISSIALYNYLRSLPVPTRIVNISTVASGAVIVYLAADERFAVKNCNFMLHNLLFPQEFKNLEYHQISHLITNIDDDTKNYVDIYKERTVSAKKQLDIIEVMKGPLIRISPDQAVEYGMANKVIPVEDIRKIDSVKKTTKNKKPKTE